MPINIDFLANVGRFLRGTEDVETALEDVADSLDDLAREASDASLEEPLTDAAKAGDRLERKFSDLAEAARDTGRAGKRIGDDMQDGTRRAAQGVDDLKEEAGQSAREAAASFSGDPVDALDFLQETAANALGGFGPLGAAAGVALAIGIGTGVAALEGAAEKMNEVKQQASELAVELAAATTEEQVESLRERWQELATTIKDERNWWEIWQSEAVTAIEQISDAAAVNKETVAAFYEAFNTSDPVARQQQLADVLGDVEAQIDNLDGRYKALYDGTYQLNDADRERADLIAEQSNKLEALRPIVEEQLQLAEQQNAVTRALADAEGLTVEQYQEKQRRLEQLTEAQDAYGSALEGAAEPTAVYNDLLQQQQDKARETAEAIAESTEDTTDSWEDYAEAASVSTQQLIDEWNRQAEEATAFEQNLGLIAAAGGESLARELAAKGPAVAGAVADVLAKASPEEQRKAIEAHARATGREVSDNIGWGIGQNGTAVQQGVDSAVGGVTAPDVPVGVRVNGAQQAVDQAARSVVPPTIEARLRVGGRLYYNVE